MSRRQLEDGVPPSALQKSRNYPATRSSTAKEAQLCRPTKTLCLASTRKAANRHLPKALKRGRKRGLKSELQELQAKNAALPQTPAEAPEEGERPGELTGGAVLPGTAGVGLTTDEPSGQDEAGLSTSHPESNCPLAREESEGGPHGPGEVGDGSTGSLGKPGLEAAGLQKTPLQMDGSVFLDDDINQPMPVGQFFGNVELMQDLPPVSAPYTLMSRREFRKMHFRAKDDDDNDDDDYSDVL
ncbi:UPF0688 protein C1orf174 homolog [Tachyglossus aculeatus]|uniref:UPF0688 protein C1orf174 homolog n=1 Tax=Tachyglossus aculeatus TaxID=9261 RepID=UPI0018F3DC0E|nr:UPF0688 protein C1orf174 homolog [Tachyglossus aculeatus]